MGSPIAHAPHSGPVDQPGEGAYLYARAGVARSASTRSNYVAALVSIDWIVRDNAGAVVSTTDLTGVILLHSLQVTQGLNEEPNSCAFTLRPQAFPAPIPQCGQEIRITWAPGTAPLFYGFIVTTQADWRLGNTQPPWIAVQCQDPMWRFDARIVTYRFPAQSVTASIAFLVKYFCNNDPTAVHALDFNLAFVAAGMPSIPAFDVVNQRPSTVMRTLMSTVDGGFYLDGLFLHAWAGRVSEPNQTNPTPLTVGLTTLHTLRVTTDATQVRRRVLVEGRRTSTLISLPALADDAALTLGAPVQDASIWEATSNAQLTRIGSQWVQMAFPVTPTAGGANPPQGKTSAAFAVGATSLTLHALVVTPPAKGWVRVGNQYARYTAIVGNPLTEGWSLSLSASGPYGVFTAPIAVESTVEWVDGTTFLGSQGLQWDVVGAGTAPGDPFLRAHATDTPVVTLAMRHLDSATFPSVWPELEAFVQDGRYSYAGAAARAQTDLDAFHDPLVCVEWETDDLNAVPGRDQVLALSSPTINPPINLTVTILRVAITFPLRTLPPRRACEGGTVKPSTFMDLVVTENN
jgi:hypothetical protein